MKAAVVRAGGKVISLGQAEYPIGVPEAPGAAGGGAPIFQRNAS